jgi:tricarballylate dehydrogenase
VGAQTVSDTDVVVVGGGSAAFAAVVCARQEGAQRVILLEKAAEAESGGNARVSVTMFRFAHRGPDELREFLPDVGTADFSRFRVAPYGIEDYVRDLHAVTRNRVNPALARTLASESNSALHWMLDQGVRWEATGMSREVDGLVYFDDPGYVMSPVDGGWGLLQHWRDVALRLGVEIRYSAQVTRLLGNDRRVEGVRVAGLEEDYEVRAPIVMLCSGGFQANPMLRARYLGRNADLMRIQGSRHDTGEVLMAALELGAASAGQWNGADAGSVDGTIPEVEPAHKPNRRAYELGITVNCFAQRFFDEAMGETDTHDTPWVVLSQPGGVAYQIMDHKASGSLPVEYERGAPPVEASTIRSLAEKLGLDADALERTVDQFNASVRDDTTYDLARTDGKSTHGIWPPKSHWARRIDEPPFIGLPVTAGITFTFGGLEVSCHAQVMNQRGNPIRGLYASGDIIGLYYHHHHLAASGQTRNVVFSRLAMKHAMSI